MALVNFDVWQGISWFSRSELLASCRTTEELSQQDARIYTRETAGELATLCARFLFTIFPPFFPTSLFLSFSLSLCRPLCDDNINFHHVQ